MSISIRLLERIEHLFCSFVYCAFLGLNTCTCADTKSFKTVILIGLVLKFGLLPSPPISANLTKGDVMVETMAPSILPFSPLQPPRLKALEKDAMVDILTYVSL